MRLHLLRHGETAANAAHRYLGQGDEPLSAQGRAQCAHLGRLPDVERVFASPLRRARQTAELCFPNAEVICVAGLAEMDFGTFEGKTAKEMATDVAYRTWVDGGCVGRCPDGESFHDFASRTTEALMTILRQAHAQGDEEVFVVCHGGTIMAAMAGLCAGPDDPFSWHVGTCEGYGAKVVANGTALQLEAPYRLTSFDHMRGVKP